MCEISDALRALQGFLSGEKSLEGAWFGEKHGKHQGLFWWRSRHLRALTKAADALDALAARIAELEKRVAELEGDLSYITSKLPTGFYNDHFKFDNGAVRVPVWLNEKEAEEIKRIAAKEPTQ